MTILIKQIISLIQLLHSDTGRNQIASGLAFGVFLGFAPFISLQTALVFTIVFIFRVQLGAATLSAFFFKFIAFLLDPVADPIGRSLLENPSLRPLWTKMYNVPFLPMTRFNNSIVLGSFAISIVLCPILFFVFRVLITKYQTHLVAKFEATPIWKAMKASKFHDWYQKYRNLYGA
ncbi:MAG: TIGR03546 family protein [Pseudobdellovibrio sp.]